MFYQPSWLVQQDWRQEGPQCEAVFEGSTQVQPSREQAGETVQLLQLLCGRVLHLSQCEVAQTQFVDGVWSARPTQLFDSKDDLSHTAPTLRILGNFATYARTPQNFYLFHLGWESSNDVPCRHGRWDGLWKVEFARRTYGFASKSAFRSSSSPQRATHWRRFDDWARKPHRNLLPQ